MQQRCPWFRLSSLLIPGKEPIQQALMAKIQMVLLRLEASSMFAEACSEAPLGISSLAAVPFSRSSRVPTKPLRRVYVYEQSCLRRFSGIVSGNLPVDQDQ